jgi:predicted Zn-dependent protease
VDLRRANVPIIIFDETVMPIAYARWNRPLEMEADGDAVRALGAVGFDPTAMASYVSRLQVDDTTRKYPVSRYPPREERLAELAKVTATVSVEPGSCNTDFPAVRDEVRQMLAPPKLPVPSLIKPSVK